MRQTILLTAIILLEAVTLASGQDCSNYDVINDGRRSTKKEYNDLTDSPICDNDLDPNQWYRFQSYVGNEIPERQPPNTVDLFHCGTISPMYIRGIGVHPDKDGMTVSAETCQNAGHGGDNCNWKGTAKIHRCPAVDSTGSFYIYQLQPPGGCDLAFCAGEDPACETGFMWDGNQCVDSFPTVGSPTFTGPHTTEGTEFEVQIYFTCSVHYQQVSGDENARIKMTFLFDDIEMENLDPPYNRLPPFITSADEVISEEIAVDLTEELLRGRLGKKISCQVETYWEGNHETSQPLKSTNSYLVSMQSERSTFDFDLDKGYDQSIPFRSTIPFTCFHCSNYPGTCPSSYNFPVSSEHLASDCYLIWRNETPTELGIQIKPNGGTTHFEVVFTPYIGDFLQKDSSLWHGYTVPTLVIQIIQKSETKVCTSISDPHITTFDNSYYNNFLTGYFSLVSAADFDGHKLEIQVQQEACNGGSVSCNCGIIVREYNTAYKVAYDDCGDGTYGQTRKHGLTVLLSQQPPDGSEVFIDETGNIYSIQMASGLRVEVYFYDHDTIGYYVDFIVYLPKEYHRKTSALSGCGNSDGLPETITDSNMFRLTDNATNYFVNKPQCDYDIDFPLPKTCECDDVKKSSSVSCSSDEPDMNLKTAAQTVVNPKKTSGMECIHPSYNISQFAGYSENSDKPSDMILDPDEIYRYVPFDPNHGANVKFFWPTPKGKIEAEVEQYCNGQLNYSPIYSDCTSATNINVIIQSCKTDIQMIDEFIDARGYIDALEHGCINNLIVSAYASNSTNQSMANILTLHNKVCPNQCSNNGSCSNSTCICNTGYVGADCSIDSSQPPSLYGSFRDGLCDTEERQCTTVNVFGQGIYSSGNLKCRFKDAKNSSTVETNGTFVTSSEVSCPVPGASGDRLAVSRQEVSISTDGSLFGSSTPFLVYDSTCMACDKNKVCTQKTNSCLISEFCYANGEMKDTKSCLQCVPKQSTTSWIDMPVVQNIKLCSRTCDVGAQTNETVCCVNNNVIDSEPVLCKESDCTAIPEEKSQGVVISLSNEHLTEVMLTPTLILSEVAKAVNDYCSEHATECCNSVGVPGGDSLTNFTSLELCPYGTGYPKVDDTSAARVKVIVKIIPQQVQQQCTQKANEAPSSGDEAYANQDIIVTAVSKAEDAIEKNLGIEILSVTKDDNSKAGFRMSAGSVLLAVCSIIVAFIVY